MSRRYRLNNINLVDNDYLKGHFSSLRVRSDTVLIGVISCFGVYDRKSKIPESRSFLALDEAISQGVLSIYNKEVFVSEVVVDGVKTLSEEIKTVPDKEPVCRNVNFQGMFPETLYFHSSKSMHAYCGHKISLWLHSIAR